MHQDLSELLISLLPENDESVENQSLLAQLCVNAKGGFGVWCWDVAFQPAQMQDIVLRHAA